MAQHTGHEPSTDKNETNETQIDYAPSAMLSFCSYIVYILDKLANRATSNDTVATPNKKPVIKRFVFVDSYLVFSCA